MYCKMDPAPTDNTTETGPGVPVNYRVPCCASNASRNLEKLQFELT